MIIMMIRKDKKKLKKLHHRPEVITRNTFKANPMFSSFRPLAMPFFQLF